MEEITLNLIPAGIHPVCHISQNDNERNIRINLTDGDLAYSIRAGDVIRLNVRKPDNTVVKTTLDITEGLSYVDIEVSDEMCDISGKNLCNLRIINRGMRISTNNFFMLVEVNPTFNPAPSPSHGLYPREIIDLIPVKPTDDTNVVSSGYAIEWEGYPYYVFDGNDNTGWISQSAYGADKHYIGYKFDDPVLCNMYRMHYANTSSYWDSQRPKRFAIQGSNDDGETWTTIYEDSWVQPYSETPAVLERTFINENEYRWYRFLMHDDGNDQFCVLIGLDILQAVY